jgi:hypothetical protein
MSTAGDCEAASDDTVLQPPLMLSEPRGRLFGRKIFPHDDRVGRYQAALEQVATSVTRYHPQLDARFRGRGTVGRLQPV